MIQTFTDRYTISDGQPIIELYTVEGSITATTWARLRLERRVSAMSLFISYLIRPTEAFGRCAKAAPLRI